MPRLSSLTRYPPLRRRSRKKGPDGLHVWPKALEHYFTIAYMESKPATANRTSREQNAYIARRFEDYTGLHRTRGQVASHLQQIRKWSQEDYGCRHAWEQVFKQTTTVSTPVLLSSISPAHASSQLPSPLGASTSITSTYSPTSSSLLVAQSLPPFQLAPVAQCNMLTPSPTMGLGLSGHWDFQGSHDVVHTLPGLSSAQPQYPTDPDLLPFFRSPTAPHDCFF